MTLDEAIRHCEEVAEGCSGTECKADHRQLAEWLKELKERREHFADVGKMERTESHACDSISRQAAIEIVRVRCARIPTMAIRAMMEIKDLPSIQPKRGKWIVAETAYEDVVAKCSVCGFETIVNEPGNGLHYVDDLHYCPNCGAQMEKGEDDD